MIKLTNGIMGLTIAIGLAGCGTTWVNLDKTEVNNEKLTNATRKCNVNKTMYNLNLKKQSNQMTIDAIGMTGKAKDNFLNFNKIESDKIIKKLNDCMKQEGYLKNK